MVISVAQGDVSLRWGKGKWRRIVPFRKISDDAGSHSNVGISVKLGKRIDKLPGAMRVASVAWEKFLFLFYGVWKRA